ncbi:MAG: tetratricopeptide repeat protein [Bacteroidia bacterium]|nr:tetratricopeptide repeat protein [Bacteroidia bacterium]
MKLPVFALIGMAMLTRADRQLEDAARRFDARDYAASAAVYRAALEAYPERVFELQYNLGQILRVQDSLPGALTYFQQAIGTDTMLSSRALTNIGWIHARAGRLDQALASFRRALEYDPANETARYDYELIRNRMPPPEPPPAQPPPQGGDPPPEQPDAPQPQLDAEYEELVRQLNQTRSRAGSDDRLAPASFDTIPLAQARRILEWMRRNELQYLQQLRKSSPLGNSRTDQRPSW